MACLLYTSQDEQAAWELGGKGYLAIQSCEDGWDYTLYHSDYSVMDGGQLGAPELTIQEAREHILEAHHMEKGRRLLQDYDAVMDKVAEAEELSADHRPSTLEKLAELASDTSVPKSSARSADVYKRQEVHMEKDKKVTALYCRLSKDDGSNSESLNIRTQKSMLMEYATRNGFGNCQYYVCLLYTSGHQILTGTPVAVRTFPHIITCFG